MNLSRIEVGSQTVQPDHKPINFKQAIGSVSASHAAASLDLSHLNAQELWDNREQIAQEVVTKTSNYITEHRSTFDTVANIAILAAAFIASAATAGTASAALAPAVVYALGEISKQAAINAAYDHDSNTAEGRNKDEQLQSYVMSGLNIVLAGSSAFVAKGAAEVVRDVTPLRAIMAIASRRQALESKAVFLGGAVKLVATLGAGATGAYSTYKRGGDTQDIIVNATLSAAAMALANRTVSVNLRAPTAGIVGI